MFIIENNRMVLTKGDSASFTVELFDAAGMPVSVLQDDVIELTVRTKPGGTLIFSAENAVGEASVEITHDMTKDIKPGVYSADVQVKRGQERYTIWPTVVYDTVGNMGNFVIHPEVTES